MTTRQKNTTAIIAVLVIWGYAGLKLTSFFEAKEDIDLVYEIPVTKSSIEFQKDTFELLLNYRDPFMSNSHLNRKPSGSENSNVVRRRYPKTSNPSTINKTIVQWPAIQCSGSIQKNGNTRPLAIVAIDGQSNLMRKGDVIKGCTLISIDKKTIVIEYNGERRSF